MICKECGVEINDEARFCPFCGTAQMVEPSDNKNKMSDDKNNDSIKLQKQNAENDESFKHDKSEEGNNVRYKDPVFKTSKNNPECDHRACYSYYQNDKNHINHLLLKC